MSLLPSTLVPRFIFSWHALVVKILKSFYSLVKNCCYQGPRYPSTETLCTNIGQAEPSDLVPTCS